jgi:type IV pilus assembly protein PilW
MNTHPAPQRPSFSPRRQAGLSLVELMVSIIIGMFLLLGLATLIVEQSSTRTELEKASRQIENGRYAMQLLHDDIQMAGFYGAYAPAADAAVTYTTPDPCDMANLGWNDVTPTVPVGIFGYEATDATPACLTNRLPNTPILVVRRTATATTAIGAAVADIHYLQVSRCDKENRPFAMASSVAAFILHTKDCGTSIAPLYRYIVRIYYIRSAAPDNIPTLSVSEFVDGARTIIPLVEGIENIQFEYGLDNVAPADGAPDEYDDDPDTAEWKDVVAVRVHLLARNIETTAGYTDNKTYNLGPAASAVAPGGAYKRHAYSELTRLGNISGRREIP